jgi:hypothetical protein
VPVTVRHSIKVLLYIRGWWVFGVRVPFVERSPTGPGTMWLDDGSCFRPPTRSLSRIGMEFGRNTVWRRMELPVGSGPRHWIGGTVSVRFRPFETMERLAHDRFSKESVVVRSVRCVSTDGSVRNGWSRFGSGWIVCMDWVLIRSFMLESVWNRS